MSFSLAGPVPFSKKSLGEKAHQVEAGITLRPEAGPYTTSMELTPGRLPARLLTTIPNQFNPMPCRATYQHAVQRAKSMQKFIAKGAKYALGQSDHAREVHRAARALRRGSRGAGKLLAVHKTHENET